MPDDVVFKIFMNIFYFSYFRTLKIDNFTFRYLSLFCHKFYKVNCLLQGLTDGSRGITLLLQFCVVNFVTILLQ